MRQLSVTINDRDYMIACEDGQEEHLGALAAQLDGRVRDLAGSIGQVGHARLLVIAGLLVSDELSDAQLEIARLKQRVDALEAEGARTAEAGADATDSARAEGAAAIDRATERLDAIAARLQDS
ncbi:cell division protein ZapA [Marivibrio halodurans]|uniref:Cell division protein ZapA n=1 Tax=Marivibrio halodurans TaxID=2039722 RepID=A0A8J7V389_9PROT|nr:cell division protein ZapA [Marivibrio halodurans]MBP5857697.1 cell division protein ZapA [Marivibrio halodurans]